MTLKEKRKQIYNFIEKEIGKIPENKIGYLSQYLKEYSKMYTEQILTENQKRQENVTNLRLEVTELKKQIARNSQTKKIQKPVSKIQKKQRLEPEPYFNSDFIR